MLRRAGAIEGGMGGGLWGGRGVRAGFSMHPEGGREKCAFFHSGWNHSHTAPGVLIGYQFLAGWTWEKPRTSGM